MKKKKEALSKVHNGKRVLLLSHIPQRDDVSDVILAQELDKMGYMVWKFPLLAPLQEKILFLKPHIVIYPEIRCEYSRDLVQLLHSWGVTVVQRRCEHGVTAESKIPAEHKRATYSNWPYSDWVDLDLIWGKKFADMVVASGSMPRKKIEVVGSPLFDQYFLPKPPVKRSKKKTVLFVTAFGCADRNPEYAIPEALPSDKMHAVEVSRNIKNRKAFGDLIEAFCKRFPKWEVHIRLHPGEVIRYYDIRFRDKINKQIKMFPPEATVVCFARVDAIIHCGSTMAYEAHLLNKPGLVYKGTTDDALITKISPKYQTIKGLLNAFAKMDITKSNADKKAIAKLTRGYFGVADGKANRRAAEAIDVLPDKKLSIPNVWPKINKANYITPDVFVDFEAWRCSACLHTFFAKNHRETVKCPWCGIACVKKVNE